MKTTSIVLVLVCAILTVWARKPMPPTCPNGQSPGPVCSDYKPCKPGYTCIRGLCCRDPVCPKGWTEGPSCNTLPGQQRCQFRYECINGFCCRRPQQYK